MYNGPYYDRGPIGDGKYFSDFARFTEISPQGETNLTFDLSIYFFDLINDFLVFSEESELFDKQPDFSQSYIWEDSDFTDNNQRGAGTFNVYESFYPNISGFERNIDSMLELTLAGVRVDSPSTWVIFIVIRVVSSARKYLLTRIKQPIEQISL